MEEENTTGRSAEFRRNDQLEILLDRLNDVLHPAQRQLVESLAGEGGAQPIVFVMGPLRSGTTLFLQWLAATGVFAYPTNLLSRFYGAPCVGALIQTMLTDDRYNYRDEFCEMAAETDFESVNGKTKGVLGPNEFWYFWRRYLSENQLTELSHEDLLQLDSVNDLVRDLEGLASISGKPFALKGMIANYHIPLLNQIFDNAFFVQLHRDPVKNIASVIDARKRQYGDEDRWYSFRIPEYQQLAALDSVDQCAGQVTFINRAISEGLSVVPENRKIVIEYEDFCEFPEAYYRRLLDLLDISQKDNPYTGPGHFSHDRVVDGVLLDRIERALEKML